MIYTKHFWTSSGFHGPGPNKSYDMCYPDLSTGNGNGESLKMIIGRIVIMSMMIIQGVTKCIVKSLLLVVVVQQRESHS